MQGGQPRRDAERPPPRGAARSCDLLFGLLVALAATGFVPGVVLPAWRDYQAVALAAQIQERQVATLRRGVEQQRQVLKAIRTDPGVASRLAQRELAYVRPGQAQVEVPGVRTVAAPTRPDSLAHDGRNACQGLAGVEPPPAVAALVRRLPRAEYDRLFCTEPSRTILMVLSGGVMLAALALYPPRRSLASGPPDDQ